MHTINLDGRYLVAVNNSANGEVNAHTLFQYRQVDDLVWATYKGGRILFGQLIARLDEQGELNARYQHVNVEGEIMTGICNSVPELLPDGRVRLHEYWRWTCGDNASGTSITEEIRNIPSGQFMPELP